MLRDDLEAGAAASYIEKAYIVPCAIDLNQLHEPCIKCQFNGSKKCDLVQGVCGHWFHFHCIERWICTRKVCPLDTYDWTPVAVVPMLELAAPPDNLDPSWISLYYGAMRLALLLHREYAQANLALASGEYKQAIAILEDMGIRNRYIIIWELICAFGSATRVARKLLPKK